jgi:hypothetical protein
MKLRLPVSKETGGAADGGGARAGGATIDEPVRGASCAADARQQGWRKRVGS